jgi:uncharacterized protein YndB with AHSA1/START domain
MSEHPEPPAPDPATLGAVRREVVLDAEPAVVWAELSGADGLAGWLADEVELDVRPGATGTVRDDGGEPRRVVVDEVVPGRRLALRWGDPGVGETAVDLALEPEGGDGGRPATRLVVVEVPVATLRLVGVAAERIAAGAGRPGGPAAGPVARALAGVA